MIDVVKRVLITEEEINKKVSELGRRISEDYKGKDLMLLGVLKGSVIFMSDLCKNITIPMSMDFMAVSSYGSSTKSSGVVRILKDLDASIEGKDVLIVEDIIDTGLTLHYLYDMLKDRDPKSLEIVTLLDKPSRRKTEVSVKYKGFSIEDEFVVGYGLDYNELYRNLPNVCVLNESVYK